LNFVESIIKSDAKLSFRAVDDYLKYDDDRILKNECAHNSEVLETVKSNL
jgi:exoribonuclease II